MTKQQFQTLHHCVYNLKFHLVLVTKYRRRCIDEPMLQHLHATFRRVAERWGANVLEFSGEADHVHMLLDIPPNIQPSKLVNNLKTVSSRLVRRDFAKDLQRHFWKPVFWSRSYCLVSTGGAPIQVFKRYIQTQERPA